MRRRAQRAVSYIQAVAYTLQLERAENSEDVIHPRNGHAGTSRR